MAGSISRISTNLSSDLNTTRFFFFPGKLAVVGGGVAFASGPGTGVGDERAFVIAARASLKGSTADGWATLGSASFFIGAFLKLGSFGFGFGAEKNDESDLASLTAGEGLTGSLLTATGFAGPTAVFDRASFFAGGAVLGVASSSLRFFALESIQHINF